MFNSLKKWVQDKAVDFTPPVLPSQPSPSSSSLLSSSSSSRLGTTSQQYFHPSTSSYEQKYHANLSSNSNKALSRPISMDSVRTSKMVDIPSLPASPVDLDLSHLSREEQEHIAKVLQRARAADEQPPAPLPRPIPMGVVPSKPSPPASTTSVLLSPLASSSSSSSTSSFNSEKPENNDQEDDNELRENEELTTATLPESTLITIHRCQVCNREQQQGNLPICLYCQNNDEIVGEMQNNSIPFTSIEQSSSPISMEFDHPEEEEEEEEEEIEEEGGEQIYDDDVMRFEQELIKDNPPLEESTIHLHDFHMDKKNENQDFEEKQQQQRHSPPIVRSQIPLESSFVKTRANNLTEIDEDDFYYQGPSPYATAIDSQPMPEKIDIPIVSSYQIDECVDEDDPDERDHVKELEETIANLTRHFPQTSEQINEIEINSKERNFSQPLSLSVDKIDIDSILEMEIESPSTDELYQRPSTSIHSSNPSSQPALHIPISVPISVNNRRGSLSRSSGVRENLTDLLATTTPTNETHSLADRPLQRTSSIHSKRVMFGHRQRRNLPSVPTGLNQLQLRRVTSESRFTLPAAPPPFLIGQSNLDDESDLLEIDLNDPAGSMSRTERSKTESEIIHRNEINSHVKSFHTTNPSPSIDRLSSMRMQTKQLRDQTTNTPPIANLNSTGKPKKKLKKKATSPPIKTNGHHTNGQTTPTQTNPPALIVPPSSSSSTMTTNPNPRKLQKSTSTEISYPFPVLKLLLSRDNLNPSRRAGNDLGLRITGGHSLPHCMEVSACIERIDIHHRNYPMLKNAVKEGDEVLEVGGVSLRGKSVLFVQNLMNSIENEFEIVVRSQHVFPATSPSIEVHHSEIVNSNVQSERNLAVSSLSLDPNIPRRHSMDASQVSANNANNANNNNNNIFVKSQSTIMPLPMNSSISATESSLSPNVERRKSVSSKERLFSVESLNRRTSLKSTEQLNKTAAQSYETLKPTTTTTILSVTTPENKILNVDATSFSQPVSRRRIYEHRNSLLPNDPGLNGVGSNQSIDRRSSNESDESDNLSQYFRSAGSRKSSLMAAGSDVPSNSAMSATHERSQSVTPIDNEVTNDATRRLQNFIKSNDEKRMSAGSTGAQSTKSGRSMERKSSAFGSFKFLKKKTKSVEFSNKTTEIGENEYVGDIQLQIGHDSDREQLVLRIIQAKNLPAKDTNGYSDPFVKVYLLPGRDQENKRRTKHISKNLNPYWDQTVIYGNVHREELQYKMLEFTVWDYDRFKANDFIGQVTIDLKDANMVDDKAHWYRLQALRSREDTSNRGSSPRLFQMTSVDSAAASTTTLNKTSLNMQSRVNQRK